MVAPLAELSLIARKEFFTDTEARRVDYFDALRQEYDAVEEKIIEGEEGMYFYNYDHSKTKYLKKSDLYIIECYEKLEAREVYLLKERVYTALEPQKIETYISYTVSELANIIDTIGGFDLDKPIAISRDIIVGKMEEFSRYIRGSYLNMENNVMVKQAMPKIRWTADIKLLTTLFFELKEGQKKTRRGEISTRSVIRANTVDIERLLIDNFLDEDGKQLNPNTIHAYLKKGKHENRVAEGGRIELQFDF